MVQWQKLPAKNIEDLNRSEKKNLDEVLGQLSQRAENYFYDLIDWGNDVRESMKEVNQKEATQEQVEKVIREQKREFMEKLNTSTPRMINQGSCIDFAEEVRKRTPEDVFPMSIHMMYEGEPPKDMRIYGGHEWIYFFGKHYDAEAPEGVDDFRELPFFKRKNFKR